MVGYFDGYFRVVSRAFDFYELVQYIGNNHSTHTSLQFVYQFDGLHKEYKTILRTALETLTAERERSIIEHIALLMCSVSLFKFRTV